MTAITAPARRYRAAFFDRDGTLTYANPEKILWRNSLVESWSGSPLDISYERMMALFEKAGEGRHPWYRDVADERCFFLRYYRHLLMEEGVTAHLDTRAKELLDGLWCNGDRLVYPEVEEVLAYFHDSGYRMGVISDTSPSLRLTLENVGLAQYFTSFTASSLVGVMKPDPRIYHAALDAQGVSAQESLYVDDYDVEADGARHLGFTAFHLNREGRAGPWVIQSLREMMDHARLNP